jgi:hypothetical protein
MDHHFNDEPDNENKRLDLTFSSHEKEEKKALRTSATIARSRCKRLKRIYYQARK